MHHIVSRWDGLADHTLFMQEEPHDFALLKQRILDYFVPQTGFMSLSYEGKLWKQCDSAYTKSWPSVEAAISRTLDMIYPDGKCGDLVFTFRGQFLVSGVKTRGNEKALYVGLLHQLLDPGSWMHAPAFSRSPWTGGKPDSLADPIFGYTLERLWGVIMRCSNDKLAYGSPSLLSSSIRSVWFSQKFPYENVQCLDEVVSL